MVYQHTGELGTLDLSEILASQLSLKTLSKQKGLISIGGIDFDIRVRPFIAIFLNFFQNIPGYDFLFPKSHLIRFIERNVRKNLIHPIDLDSDSLKNFKLFLISQKLNTYPSSILKRLMGK